MGHATGRSEGVIIRHNLPTKSFIRIDRHVYTDRRLSDGAKVLYGYLCGLVNGAVICDKYIIKAMGISQAVLTKRKRELKDTELLLVDQISPRLYVAYIGYSTLSAGEVKRIWLDHEDRIKQGAETK